MHVRLTRKLAERVDGIDLAGHREGDVLELGQREAELLIAEGWAKPVADDTRELRGSTVTEPGVKAADARRQMRESVERVRVDRDSTNSGPREYRPGEDRVRGASHDEGPRIPSSRHHRRK